MKRLESFLRPDQKRLFEMLRNMFKGRVICRKKAYVLVHGEAPILLVAHLDTVHEQPVLDICTSKDGNILMSPQGIGGDDRCGVYAICSAYELSKVKPWLLFTCDEEVGGVGADEFVSDHIKKKLPKGLDDLKLIVEVDRRGSRDAVYYDCDNEQFEDYITSKGFKTEYGSFSDISVIAPELGVAAVNLSSGYYNAHTLHEYIVRPQLEKTTLAVADIVEDASHEDFPKFEYVPAFYPNDYYDGPLFGIRTETFKKLESMPKRKEKPHGIKDLPPQYREMYDELLYYYTERELDDYREMYGDEVIKLLFDDEFGPEYGSAKLEKLGEDEEDLK